MGLVEGDATPRAIASDSESIPREHQKNDTASPFSSAP
jgi:hypothetical protein